MIRVNTNDAGQYTHCTFWLSAKAKPPAPILFPTNAKLVLAIFDFGVAVFMMLWPIEYTMMIVDMIRNSIRKSNNLKIQTGGAPFPLPGLTKENNDYMRSPVNKRYVLDILKVFLKPSPQLMCWAQTVIFYG